MIDYLADEEGWAHSLQVHPDGSADYVRHRPTELDKSMRYGNGLAVASGSRADDAQAVAMNLIVETASLSIGGVWISRLPEAV
jgi:hypothetical protein